jgi:hypothetical protein
MVDFTHSYETPQYLMLSVLIIGGACWLGIDASKKIIIAPNVSNFILTPDIA